jgi:hypothetical protein
VSAVTESWRRDILGAFSRRFDPNGRDRPLAELAKCDCGFDVWKPILLWHITRNEFLLRDFLTNWLYEQYQHGVHRVSPDDVAPYLTSKNVGKRIKNPWQAITLRRLSNALLQNAVDFGLMQGGASKEFVSYHMPESAFLYLLHAVAVSEPNARRIVDSDAWHMYLMDASDVERELLRLHQFRKVQYEVAGSLAQLKLSHGSPGAFAREMCS